MFRTRVTKASPPSEPTADIECEGEPAEPRRLTSKTKGEEEDRETAAKRMIAAAPSPQATSTSPSGLSALRSRSVWVIRSPARARTGGTL